VVLNAIKFPSPEYFLRYIHISLWYRPTQFTLTQSRLNILMLLHLLAALTWTWWSWRFVQPWAPWIWIQPVVRVIRDVTIARRRTNSRHRLQTHTHNEPICQIHYADVLVVDHTRSGIVHNFEDCLAARLSVCLYVCNTITVESFDVGSSFLLIRCISRDYEGHQVKFKVTGAKKVDYPYSRNVKL